MRNLAHYNVIIAQCRLVAPEYACRGWGKRSNWHGGHIRLPEAHKGDAPWCELDKVRWAVFWKIV